jgi:glycosyltransferase involved in cell wall biosynthesis
MSDLVSIIMNCKDGEEYLLESLQSILDQTYKNWELIFVDNNSKDNSKNIFLDFKDSRFKYFYINKSVSLGMARQYAYEKCNGKLIITEDFHKADYHNLCYLSNKKYTEIEALCYVGKFNDRNPISKQELHIDGENLTKIIEEYIQ